MWPEIPATFEGMSAAELRTLRLTILSATREAVAANPRMSTEDHAEWQSFVNLAAQIRVLADQADVQEADEAAETARLAAEVAAAEAAAAEQAAAEVAEPVVEETVEVEVPELVAAGAVSTSLSVPSQRIEVVTPQGLARWHANVGGDMNPTPGAAFSGIEELADTIMQRGRSVAGSNLGTKEYVGLQQANFGDRADYDLTANPYFNLNRFQYRNDDELTAAMCAPLTPLYDLSCDNSTRRPVAMGLPNFRLSPDRGGFSVYPSPSLSDITTGYGQWLSADDQDSEAIKSACQTITCSSPTEYEIYGIYRCLTVKNLVNMTFREIVLAYLNRLEARWARFAETLLLEAMGTASTQIDAPAQGFNANTSLKRVILTYLGLYQEIERWDVPTMDAWMPRWLLFALRMDEMSRRRHDGGLPSAPSEEAINQSFRDVGVEPHWYMDRPSWATPIPNLATTGALNFFPSSVEILVHKRGKFALMDRGNLQIGVEPSNIYRLGDDLRRNQFTFFMESFEGLIDTDSCPAHILQVPNLCYNGVQIADTFISCEGGDVIGSGS